MVQDRFAKRANTPSAKFPTPGTVVSGRITEIGDEVQAKNYNSKLPEFWTNRTPKMQFPIQLDTGQGVVALWVVVNQHDAKFKAIQAAQEASGAIVDVGGHLQITFTHLEVNPKFPGANAAKQFSAVYTPPTPEQAAAAQQAAQASAQAPVQGNAGAPPAGPQSGVQGVPGPVQQTSLPPAVTQTQEPPY